jgi:hypothetical protein
MRPVQQRLRKSPKSRRALRGEENVARLFRTLVSAVAAAFLIVSPGHGQVRQAAEPESARQNQAEPEHRVQSLVGNWKLLEVRAFDDAGHELPQAFGPQPMGFAVFEAERMIVVVADGRTSPPADALPRAFVSYGGNYQFDGTKLVIHADSASNPGLIKDHVRHVEFEGKDRFVATLAGQNGGVRLVWERVR